MPTHAQILQSWFPWTIPPLLCAAPMRGVSGSALTVAAANAGALAFYGAGYSVDDAATLADIARVPAQLAPGVGWGIGFLLFKCALPAALALVAQHAPAAVWLFAPRDAAQLCEWVAALRAAHPRTRVFVQVGSVREVRALVAAGAAPDAVVAQGSADAGGHGLARGGSWATLVPELRDFLAGAGLAGVPVLGAGGVMDARGVVGVLGVGGSGAVLGTAVSARAGRSRRGG